MRLDEVAVLLAETRAMYPGMMMVPGIADAWHKILAPFDIDDCRVALTQHVIAGTGIPGPPEIRKLVIAARQDQAMRALPRNSSDLIPMPPWFHDAVAESKAATRKRNLERVAAGEKPDYGEALVKPSDRMRR